MARGCFPVSHTGNIVSSVSFCFQDANYAYATRQGILTKIRACEHLQNFCEHEKANTLLIFASNSSKGQILRALSNWMGPFGTPNINSASFIQLLLFKKNILRYLDSHRAPLSSICAHTKPLGGSG